MNSDDNNNSKVVDMSLFEQAHKDQLEALQIPSALWGSLAEQLHESFPVLLADPETESEEDGEKEPTVFLDPQGSIEACQEQFHTLPEKYSEGSISSQLGTMLVLPLLCSWEMLDGRGMWEALSNLPRSVLQSICKSIMAVSKSESVTILEEGHELVNRICALPEIWSYVILYRGGGNGAVRAAIPAPPYLPHVEYSSESDLDRVEADLVGPFPFQYYHKLDPSGGAGDKPKMLMIECSLAYISGESLMKLKKKQLPSIDVVPAPTVPNKLTRIVRYAALLGPGHAPDFAISQVKEIHASFVRNMHMVRQNKLEADLPDTADDDANPVPPPPIAMANKAVWKVYTDAPKDDDPLKLAHPECGLTSPRFEIVSDPNEADILYSYNSLYSPRNPLHGLVQERSADILINQFPYEGALVQKDHLGREILQQHGLPRPSWALETYDLDVQLGEFIGGAILAQEERNEDPLWIVKPAQGTRSRGHVVTRNLAQIVRLMDAGGGSKVAQRYIENPICYNGRKVDCRCIVMMTSATPGQPTLYMHNRVFFRIAAKEHSVATPEDLVDREKVMTAMYLVDKLEKEKNSSNNSEEDNNNNKKNKPERMTLPVDYKTIAQLEEEYKDVGFDWKEKILPNIQKMICELFNGMTLAYPAMGKSPTSRAIYGIDIMFEKQPSSKNVDVKLTEVTFCPSNNAVDVDGAFERDEQLYREYNNEVFRCLFLDDVSENITKLQ